MTRTRLTALFVLMVVAATGCGGSHGPQTVRVSAKGLSIRIERGGAEVTELGGAQAPFVYWLADGSEHQATRPLGHTSQGAETTYRFATDDASRTMTLVVTHTRRAVRFRYGVEGAAGVAAVGFAMAADADAHFLGTGTRERWVDMAKTVQPLKVYNGCGSSSPSSFFTSTDGFGAWVSSTAVGRIAFPDAVDDTNFACDLGTAPCSVGPPIAAVRWCFKAASVDFTIATGTIAQVVTAHARAVGLPREPWLPQFALMKWRDEVSGPSELFDDIRQLRARDIPIGWVILDNPWEQGSATADCYGSLTFDAAKYPSPKQLIAKVHARGVRFMLWISPQIKLRDCTPAPSPDGWMTGDDATLVRDLTLPAERDDFVRRLEALVALGVDGFKGDRGDEVNLEPDHLAGGAGTVEQNAYPLRYDRAAAAALESAHGAGYATLFRAAVAGSSAVLPGFVGPDAEQSFTGLEGEIRAAQNAGVSGIPVWGSDIGGYAGGSLTATLFVRWAQFAALTPIFEVGGAGANATFWQLGDEAVRGFRDAATLHYELVPYLYSLARAAARTGIPVVRTLGLTWPDEAQAWASDTEFTVGPDLLAAPVDQDTSTSAVYLPPGEWTDVFTGETSAGGSTVMRTNGPDDFPLYLRAGTAIPFAFRKPGLWSDAWRPDDLLRANRQGWLVSASDDGTIASVADRGATVVGRSSDSKVTLTIRHPLAEEQVRVFAPSRMCGVRLNGRALSRASASTLKGSSSAWARWQASTIVKVTHTGRAPIELALEACA